MGSELGPAGIAVTVTGSNGFLYETSTTEGGAFKEFII